MLRKLFNVRRFLKANFTTLGIERLWRGMRTNDAQMVAVGLGLVLFQQFRSRKPTRELIHSQQLKPGDELTIKVDRR